MRHSERAYIVEPLIRFEKEMLEQYKKYSAGESWEIRKKEIEDLVKKIQKKYPDVVVLNRARFTTVIRVPQELQVQTLEKEFSCALIPVRYTQG